MDVEWLFLVLFLKSRPISKSYNVTEVAPLGAFGVSDATSQKMEKKKNLEILESNIFLD